MPSHPDRVRRNYADAEPPLAPVTRPVGTFPVDVTLATSVNATVVWRPHPDGQTIWWTR